MDMLKVGWLGGIFAGLLLALSQSCDAKFGESPIVKPISGRALNQTEILPADVLSRVQLVRAEIELIRLELGKPPFPVGMTRVLDTAPREVYFMANTLYAKADRLAFELLKTSDEDTSEIDTAAITPYHVWLMVNKTFSRLQMIKKQLGIVEISSEKSIPPDTTPSDVIQSIIRANQELGRLLSQQVAPADVFQQVTRAINLNAQLLATFDGTSHIPVLPDFVRRKTPGNVYRRLTGCFELIRQIAQISNQRMLRFDTESLYSGFIEPSDVYMLATLVVAELSYFHDSHPDARMAALAYYPGTKTPSQVYQRVGILHIQLKTLYDMVKADPDWLKNKPL
jgi:hypothetical protein